MAEKSKKSRVTYPNLGRAMLAYFKVYRQRLKADSDAAKLKTREVALQKKCTDLMLTGELEVARCSAGTLTIINLWVTNVTDWEKFWAFCKKKDVLHLLQKRLAQSNITEMLEHDPDLASAGIPGTERKKIMKVTPTKKQQ